MEGRHGEPSSPKMAGGNGKEKIMEEPQTITLDSSNATWIKKIECNMQHSKPFWKKEPTTMSACIFRVPASLLRQSRQHYQPKVVSIGPYNRSNSKLPIKDKDKWACVNYFVTHRSLNLKNWLRDMRSREQEARSYYSEDVSMDSQIFFEMLLRDGCFILHAIEFINDPKVYLGWPSEQIMLDFLMLENQIPFFVLVQLYRCVIPPGDILVLTFRFFWKNLPVQRYIWNSPSKPNQVLHLLHLFRLSLVPAEDESIDITSFNIPTHIPSATELQDRSAMKFKKSYTRNMLNIRFSKGVMEIPVLQIHDAMNTLLRNVIAFEQVYTPIKPYLTAYAAFMEGLISEESDVKLLERSGILLNKLPTSRDATFFFSQLSPRGKFRNLSTYLDDIVVDVDNYHKNIWNRWYTILKLDYFSNPWVTLSVVASAVLLVLSFIQTYWSVLSYYHL